MNFGNACCHNPVPLFVSIGYYDIFVNPIKTIADSLKAVGDDIVRYCLKDGYKKGMLLAVNHEKQLINSKRADTCTNADVLPQT